MKNIFLALIALSAFLPARADEGARAVRGELVVRCDGACVNAMGCGCVMEEFRSLPGVRIVAAEALSGALVEIKINRQRSDALDIGLSYIAGRIKKEVPLRLVLHDFDRFLFEAGRGEPGIKSIGSININPDKGRVIPLSDIAKIRIVKNDKRRPFEPGDRELILTIEAGGKHAAELNKLIDRKYRSRAGASWRILPGRDKN